MENKWITTLSKALIFRGFSCDDLNLVLKCLNPKGYQYEKNQVIDIDGIKEKGLGIILSGSLVVSKENAKGDRMIIMTLEPGDMFGETTNFLGSGIWNDTVYAQDVCEILYLPKEKLLGGCDALCKIHKTLILNLLQILSEKTILLNKKVEYMAMKSIKEKISNYLLEQYKNAGSLTFVLPLNRNDLADFLHVTRPSLSRELCRMRDEAIIEFHRSLIRIINFEALKRRMLS